MRFSNLRGEPICAGGRLPLNGCRSDIASPSPEQFACDHHHHFDRAPGPASRAATIFLHRYKLSHAIGVLAGRENEADARGLLIQIRRARSEVWDLVLKILRGDCLEIGQVVDFCWPYTVA